MSLETEALSNLASIDPGMGGWAIAVLLIAALMRGDLVTRREAALYRERAEQAEALSKELVDQNTVLLETSRLAQGTFVALRKKAE